MRHLLLAAVVSLVGCASNESAKGAGAASGAPPAGSGSVVADKALDKPPEKAPEKAPDKKPPDVKPPVVEQDTPPPGHDFTAVGKALLVVGACGDGARPDGFSQELIDKHCKVIKEAQGDYHDKWVTKARAFFAEKVPATAPKKVVYPFAGGDLSTALTVYPDADEITTMSLEPAGDPRTLVALNVTKPEPLVGKTAKPVKPSPARTPKELEKALGTVESELKFLYRVNFSNTMNMIEAMRGGELPTQLIFGLSALKVHGFEVVSLRYFKLDKDGVIVYLTDQDVAKAPDARNGRPDARNRLFANAEVRFKKPTGRVQTYRHIQVNLDNEHLKKDARVIKHLEAKAQVAGMTKAASYLLSWESFSTMRNYLTKHVAWMVSDATGVAPKWGKPAGFEYETYGQFLGPHMNAGLQISKDWKDEFTAQTKRELSFRFGYPDSKQGNTLVIMKKKS